MIEAVFVGAVVVGLWLCRPRKSDKAFGEAGTRFGYWRDIRGGYE